MRIDKRIRAARNLSQPGTMLAAMKAGVCTIEDTLYLQSATVFQREQKNDPAHLTIETVVQNFSLVLIPPPCPSEFKETTARVEENALLQQFCGRSQGRQ